MTEHIDTEPETMSPEPITDPDLMWLFEEVDRILTGAFDRIFADLTGEGLDPRRVDPAAVIATAVRRRRPLCPRVEPVRWRSIDRTPVETNQRGPPRRTDTPPGVTRRATT